MPPTKTNIEGRTSFMLVGTVHRRSKAVIRKTFSACNFNHVLFLGCTIKLNCYQGLWELSPSISVWGFLTGTTGKEPICQCKRCKRHVFNPWVGKVPWRRTWPSTPVLLPGESHGQRSLAGYSPWRRTESDTTEGA